MEGQKYSLGTPNLAKANEKDTGLAEIIATIILAGLAAATAIWTGSKICETNTYKINKTIYSQFYPQYTLK